ncbi:MAG TPA: condensation domain-containing protein, partial [Micromonospora sp.]
MSELLSPRKAALLAVLRARRAGTAGGAGPAGTIRPVTGDEPPVASAAQRQMWYLDRAAPGEPAYLAPVAWRLRGPLDTAALAAAVDALVARHEPLRTTLTTVDDQPVPVVGEPWPGLLRLVDLSTDTGTPRGAGATREADLADRLAAEAATPIDLAHGPVLRATLFRLDPADHTLVLTFHHAAVDEWSLRVVADERAELYAAGRAGRQPRLPALPVRYRDYAAWQRRWLTGPEAAAQCDWWRDQLAGAPPVLELPTGRTRPAVPSSAGTTTRHPLHLPVEAVRALCRRLNVTPYLLLLAAFQVLLARVTGQYDVPVGTPVANRNRPETEPLVGLFVNTLVIRTDLADDPTFEELVARVRATVLAARERQELPFARLVEELRPERAPGHTPLFQVMFVHADAPAPLRLDGLDAEPVELPAGTAKFDLTVAVRPGPESFEAVVEARTDLFDA